MAHTLINRNKRTLLIRYAKPSATDSVVEWLTVLTADRSNAGSNLCFGGMALPHSDMAVAWQ